MLVTSIYIRRLQIPFTETFAASYGTNTRKECILVSVETDTAVGHGECSALADPFYLEETVDTAWLVLQKYLLPALIGQRLDSPADIPARLAHVRGHKMAKAGVESAVWDAFAQSQQIALATALGGVQEEIAIGISLGLYAEEETLIKRVEEAVTAGYQRIKVKIAPGHDIAVVRAIREEFGAIALSVDANGAYTLRDIGVLKELDDYQLTMIEQPLAFDDLWDHAQLQPQLRTPICLDESIRSEADARKAIAMNACRIICVKPGRVGGLEEARKLVMTCERLCMPVWCGGMYETGVGRLAVMALASLKGITMASDLSPSARYFAEDIVEPPIACIRPGWLQVPDAVGLGASISWDRVDRYTIDRYRA